MNFWVKAYNESCKVSAMIYAEMNKAFEIFYPNEYGYLPDEENAYKFCCTKAMNEVIDGIKKRMFYS